jgi:serine phosphatase RsbU (regulator of sigma subunit)
VQTVDDTGVAGVMVERLPSTIPTDPQEGRLQLLIDCIANLNAAEDESALARAAVAAALKGTGFRRAAMLRADAADSIEVLAALRRDVRSDEPFVFSRSLVREAGRGHVVTMSSSDVAMDGRSIADLGIQSALCLPVQLGGAVAAVLYLDSRRGERAADSANTAYCEAVARACGLAMANLKRADLERRQAALHQELSAAREVQRVLVPPESGVHGAIRYSVRMQPGLFVAGDLFDVFPLADGRVSIFIGDVSGHGLGPALVMAMTQAHLHAQLATHADPARVIEEVNRYVADHVADGRYVSLWLGIASPDGEIRYVDAGHGHWRVVRARGGSDSPASGGGIPVGIDRTRRFAAESVRLSAGDRLLLFSDGVVEQRNPAGDEFGVGRLLEAAGLPGAVDPAEAIDRAMKAFAAGLAPSDDATVACITVDAERAMAQASPEV